MMNLPDTTARRSERKQSSWPVLLLVVAILAVSALLVVILLRGGGFSPGEDISSESVRDISASLEDTAYPPQDILVFEGGARTVYLYLSVSELARDTGLSVDVGRSSSESLFGWISGGGAQIEVSGGGEDQLAPSGNGMSGVIKFEISASGGGELPEGEYTVEVMDGETQAVEKRFLVRG